MNKLPRKPFDQQQRLDLLGDIEDLLDYNYSFFLEKYDELAEIDNPTIDQNLLAIKSSLMPIISLIQDSLIGVIHDEK